MIEPILSVFDILGLKNRDLAVIIDNLKGVPKNG